MENPRLHSESTPILVHPSKGPAFMIEKINQAIMRMTCVIL